MVYHNSFLITTKLPIDRLWAVLSDTSRMNKAMGLPAWEEAELNGSRVVRTKVLGQQQEWVEAPWTWLINKEIRQARTYKKGLMYSQTGSFKILSEKTSDGLYKVQISFTWFGNLFLKFVLGPLSAKFLKKQMTAYVKTQEEIYFANTQAKINQLTPLRLLNQNDDAFIAKILSDLKSNNPILKTILQYLVASDSLDIHKINPKKLSANTGLNLNLVVEHLTTLTQNGYLALTWDVVCPHCRGPQQEVTKLQLVNASSICLTCDLEFSAQSERSVEVSFKPQTKFRKVGSIVFCAAEPAKKTHILMNWAVEKEKKIHFKIDLTPGRYRIRTVKGKKECDLVVGARISQPNVTIDFTQSEIKIGGSGLASGLDNIAKGEYEFTFTSQADDFLVLESLAWTEDKYLAGEALSNSHIRTLLNDDLLKSGVKLDIGEQIILFTDIVGSTPLYRKLGDSKAFVAVQDHYLTIEKIIKLNQGVVVKFIGDAVMAAFTDAALAFKANNEIHLTFKTNYQKNNEALVLRTSFHIGQVLCVNMNVGLDYFGQTVNTAAKLQGWADGFETAVSEQTLNRVPENQRLQLSIKRTGFDEKLHETVHVY